MVLFRLVFRYEVLPNVTESEEKKLSRLRNKQPPAVFCEKDVLKSFPDFTGKHLCWSLF